MVFENGEELSEDRTPILDERDSVSYEEFGGDQVRNYSEYGIWGPIGSSQSEISIFVPVLDL